jgi:SAM-dependent methyltransferase
LAKVVAMIASMAANYAHRVDEYVAGRPGYPVELVSDLPPADTIVELGAGTGKFTRLLALTGKAVVAVEPVEQMAARIQSDCPAGVEVRIGTAEAIPVADDAADLVCSATAFHWFDYARATREIIRVLRQDGALALVWNIRNERLPWVAAFCRLIDGYAGNTPRRTSGEWRAIFDDARFEYLGRKRYAWSHAMPPRALVDRALSTSFIAVLPPSEQKHVCDRVLHIVENDPALVGKDEIQFPYVTELQVFRRRA